MAENTLCSFSTEGKAWLTLFFKNESLSRQAEIFLKKDKKIATEDILVV